jgi:dihydropteroate synthase
VTGGRPGAAFPSFAGLSLDVPVIMGIVNVTPDSFSDGGETQTTAAAIRRGRAMIEAGARIIDLGGASSRPGADPLPAEVEARRVLPVIRGLAPAADRTGTLLSIDTSHAALMEAALEAGAAILNDITALTGDADAMGVARASRASVVLMHMRGEPKAMNRDPGYADVVGEVLDYLARRVDACEKAGIPAARLAVDPGIGFGKTMDHNRALLDNLDRFSGLGCAVLVGASRKMGGGADPRARLRASLDAALAAVQRGANILRVHDVAETRAALDGAQRTATKS